MFGAAIIVFREVLEAALIVSLVLAATRGIAKRGYWISAGVLGGLIVAGLVALIADVISAFAAGMGLELFNALVLFAAVLMLSWHLIWMQKHGAEMARQVKNVSHSIAEGETPKHVMAIVVGLAVMREGAEVVLFMNGMLAAGSQSMAMLSGAAIGLLGGFLMGTALYMGLLRIPTRYLFRVTGVMILLLAAGLAAQGAFFLAQADYLPALGYDIWNTSSLLSEKSVFGSILHILIGYVANPTGIQILFYFATLLIIWGMTRLVNRSKGNIVAS